MTAPLSTAPTPRLAAVTLERPAPLIEFTKATGAATLLLSTSPVPGASVTDAPPRVFCAALLDPTSVPPIPLIFIVLVSGDGPGVTSRITAAPPRLLIPDH